MLQGEGWQVQDKVRNGHKSNGVKRVTAATTAIFAWTNAATYMEKGFTAKQFSVSQDFFCADAEAQKQSHNDGDEQEWRHVFTGAKLYSNPG